MIKLEIISVDEYNSYVVKNNDKEYNLVINFHGDNIPKIGDFIYLSNNILKEVNIYNFGPIEKKYLNDSNINEEEIMKVLSKDKEYYLQRYYG